MPVAGGVGRGPGMQCTAAWAGRQFSGESCVLPDTKSHKLHGLQKPGRCHERKSRQEGPVPQYVENIFNGK